MYQILHGLAAPPLEEFVVLRSNISGRRSRASMRGGCAVPGRHTVSHQVWSVKGPEVWNEIPDQIRECRTYNTFKVHLKKWLKGKQVCQHWFEGFKASSQCSWFFFISVSAVQLFYCLLYLFLLSPFFSFAFVIEWILLPCQGPQVESSLWLLLTCLHVHVY